jgi:hypothetical protein
VEADPGSYHRTSPLLCCRGTAALRKEEDEINPAGSERARLKLNSTDSRVKKNSADRLDLLGS